MKVFSGRNFCMVGAVVIGLAVAWITAVPGRTSGERVRGSCLPCTGEEFRICPPRPRKKCTKQALMCNILEGGPGECYTTEWSPCVPDLNCMPVGHQTCVGA